ncbi:MAG: hypothetical protein IJJ26_13635 [Victivallales bacterium]|nr:hypothetical protein [Victivallales bacterium]
MSDLLSILGGIVIGIGTLAVIVIGIYYDRLQYEERHPERKNKKKAQK